MREEEKLARDVYTQLAKTSTLPIFRNISRAESQHMQAIERLLRGGGRNVLNDKLGVFAFADYQQLYDSLVASGSRSPLDALKVGAKIEEMDIADLRQMLNQANDQQVRQVLQHLLQGSQNHLRAFASQITRQGASYNAEFLSQADFDQIAKSSEQGQQSRRGGNAGGQGSQNGGNGPGFGFQGQNSGGQGLGGQGLDGQGQRGQGRGRQGGGGKGRGR
jgi:rubrerythrin